MKKTIIKIICAILLMAFAMSAIACGSGNIYEDLAEEGYAVRVRFDVGDGGLVNDTQGVTVVEAYDASATVTANGKTGIRVLAPEDPARGEDGVFRVSRSKDGILYFSAGWYTGRTEVTPGQYVYSGLWDFANDVIDPGTLENGEMTLYAAWIPSFTYEFYAQKEDGSFEQIGSKRKIDLTMPKWNERREKWDMKDLPEVAGKVFEAAYFDEALTQRIAADAIDGDGLFVNYESGTATQSVIKVYITLTDATA
jgi:hypothetical protein